MLVTPHRTGARPDDRTSPTAICEKFGRLTCGGTHVARRCKATSTTLHARHHAGPRLAACVMATTTAHRRCCMRVATTLSGARPSSLSISRPRARLPREYVAGCAVGKRLRPFRGRREIWQKTCVRPPSRGTHRARPNRGRAFVDNLSPGLCGVHQREQRTGLFDRNARRADHWVVRPLGSMATG